MSSLPALSPSSAWCLETRPIPITYVSVSLSLPNLPKRLLPLCLKVNLMVKWEMHNMAMQARLRSQALRKLSHSLSTSQTILILIDQVRSKLANISYFSYLEKPKTFLLHTRKTKTVSSSSFPPGALFPCIYPHSQC